jgi:peptidoglycan/LPS O-acetylase OafA/YrhL
MGGLSYGMYLLHLIAISFSIRILAKVAAFSHGGAASLVSLAIVLVVTVFMAELMRRAVELPALRCRRFLVSRPRWEIAAACLQVSLIPTGVAYALSQRFLF